MTSKRSVPGEKNNKNAHLLILKQCGRCGKRVFIPDTEKWAYRYKSKNKTNYFCSWSCMQESRKAFPKNADPVGTWKYKIK